MTLFLQRIIGRRCSFDFDFFRFYFKRLFRLGRQHKRSVYDERRADVLSGDFVVIVYLVAFENNLHVFKTTSVVKLDKAERLGISYGFSPAHYGDFLAAELFFFSKNIF